jgi:hypothetical protein
MRKAATDAWPAGVSGARENPGYKSTNYFAATLLDCATRSRSITVRQPTLSWALCLNMQAVMADTFGMSELHSRNASPVHICCASALKAKLELDDNAEKETAKASIKPAWRIVLVKDAVMVGSLWPGSAGRF